MVKPMHDITKIFINAAQTRDERLHFLNISSDINETLQHVRALIIPHLPEIVDIFYNHLSKFSKLNAMLGGPSR
ncbi:hypothetical protein VZ95_20110, partial [Elstera litoralis]